MAINYPQRYDDDFLNTIKTVIDHVNAHGKTIQDLVAEGQLTEEQYGELIKYINGLIDKNELEETKASLGATVNALIQQFNLKPLDDPIYIENLWDPEDTVPGSIDQNSGVVVDHESNRTSNFTPIFPNQNYTYLRPSSANFRVVYFDSDQNYIEGTSWISGGEPVTMMSPSNAAYQRVTLAIGSGGDYRTAPFYIAIGDYVPEGVKDGDAILYDGGFWENIPTPPLKPDSVNKEHLKSRIIEKKHLTDGIIGPENTTFFKKPDNLFDGNYTLNISRSSSGTVAYTSNDSARMAVVPVTSGETYNIRKGEGGDTFAVMTSDVYPDSTNQSLYFTPIQDFLGVRDSSAQEHSVTIDAQANWLMVQTNVFATDLPEYLEIYSGDGLVIPSRYIEGGSSSGGSEKGFDWLNHHRYFIDGEIDGYYEAPQIEDKSDTSEDPLRAYGPSEFYNLYDSNLVAQYPELWTKSTPGNDASGGYPIHRYDFKIPNPSQHGDWQGHKKIKIILTSGSHPEKQGMYCLYKAMEIITKNPTNNTLIDTLRNHIHFIILPVWSPWAVVNATRWNANEVNIGRNFPFNFVQHDVGHVRYGGAEPLSEPEAQYLHDIFMENKDGLAYIDFHNFFNNDGFLWTPAASLAIAALGEQHIKKMTSKWKNKYPEIPQDESHFVGFTTARKNTEGSYQSFAESLGIRTTTYEVSQQAYFEDGNPRHSALANTLGTEAFINFLLAITKYTIEEKNSRK